MNRSLIVGASGFAGRRLAAKIASRNGATVVGTFYSKPPAGDLPYDPRPLDLFNMDQLNGLIAEVRPDVIYHLAGMAFPPDAQKNPKEAFRVNVEAGINLLDAVTAHAPDAKILYVSSGEVYGLIGPGELPVTEGHIPKPAAMYAASKYCMEIVCEQYRRSRNLDIRIARPFNHTGPGQDEDFVAPAFALQVAHIEAERADPVIRTGSLDVVRDFLDADDVVRAYTDIMENGIDGGVYNICSGRGVTIQSILDQLLALSTVNDIRHEFDPEKMRPAENKTVIGSADRLTALTGWRPLIPIESTLASLLDDCRKRVLQAK
jgi:GDP-4-dehydro-6-deoxy-D-mannose reductase